MLVYLLGRELFSNTLLVWISNSSGEVAKKYDHFVTELAQLLKHHEILCMAEVKSTRYRINTMVDT